MPRRQPSRDDATTATTLTERVDAHLLGRGLVVVSVSEAPTTSPETPASRDALTALESAVLDRGHLLQRDLRTALGGLGADGLARARTTLLGALDARLGADKPHVPLFRRFPFSTPADTERLWVDRVLTLLFQAPDQPCALCGTVGSVHAVSPCAHLVCRVCFDGSDYSACPVCRRRIDPDDPFLQPTGPRRRAREAPAGPLRLLRPASGRDDAVLDELDRLLPRSAAPSAADLDAITVLVDHQAVVRGADLGWLPPEIPARTARATVLARLLARRETREAAVGVLPDHCGTATDVLRTAVVLTGGAADLTPSLGRTRNLSRPLRRALLATLDGLPVQTAAEDVLRHVPAWKKVAEKLHPFEHAHQHPRAALLVAIARGTSLAALDPGLRALVETVAGDHPETVVVDGDRLRVATFAGAVEGALAEGRLDTALRLLATRPGELFRRLDQLLSLAVLRGDAPVRTVLDAAARTAPRVSPAVLVSALGELAHRDEAESRRVFFPAGRIASLHTAADQRPPLPADVVAAARSLLEHELLERAADLGAVRVAVLDADLASVPVPFTARTTSRALVEVPRGTVLPLPDGEVLRLFLHWTEPRGTRVDLDLSVAFFDADWAFVGLCDYTNMRFEGAAAVHSGDLTSAPSPLGATEFVDLDLAGLGRTGASYAVPVVFSYNDVPFDQMEDAFAGLMVRSAQAAREDVHLDAGTVQQRFDLAGEARIAVPMVVDLAAGRSCWLDMNLSTAGYGHNVRGYSGKLAHLGRSLLEHHTAGRRTSMWQLATWHAAARAETVLVRRGARVDVLERGPDEAAAAFACRIATPDQADRTLDALPDLATKDGSVFAALVHGDVALPDGSSAYALLPGPAEAGDRTLSTGLDLLSELAPRTTQG